MIDFHAYKAALNARDFPTHRQAEENTQRSSMLLPQKNHELNIAVVKT